MYQVQTLNYSSPNNRSSSYETNVGRWRALSRHLVCTRGSLDTRMFYILYTTSNNNPLCSHEQLVTPVEPISVPKPDPGGCSFLYSGSSMPDIHGAASTPRRVARVSYCSLKAGGSDTASRRDTLCTRGFARSRWNRATKLIGLAIPPNHVDIGTNPPPYRMLPIGEPQSEMVLVTTNFSGTELAYRVEGSPASSIEYSTLG